MNHFLAMGGYAGFIWPAYGASLGGILLAILLSLRAYRQAKARLAALETRPP